MEEQHLFSPLSVGIDKEQRASGRQTRLCRLMIGLSCLVAKSFLIPENCYMFKSNLEIWS